MANGFHERFDREEVELPPDRSTGLVLAGAALAAAYLGRGTAVMWISVGVAAVLALASLTRPILLRPLNIAWMRLAMAMSRVINPIVMLVLFAVAIVPAGLLMQLKRDPLRRRRTQGASYWVDRSKDARSSMRNQF